MSSRIKQFDVVDLARLAAFVDGEGHITICRNNKKAAGCSFALELAVSNTDIRLVQWCLDTFKVGKIRSQLRDPKWKRIYHWECYSREAQRLLLAMYPYLLIKQEQVDLVIEFSKLVGPVGTNRVSPENCAKRMAIVTQLQSLHKNREVREGSTGKVVNIGDMGRQTSDTAGTPVTSNTLAPRSQVEAVVGGQSGR